MVANSHDRTALIGQLAWQHDMGIDEILLDVPAPDAGLSLSALTLPPGPPSVPAPAIRDIPATADTAPAATPSVGAAPPPESTPKQTPEQTPESTPVPISAPPSALAAVSYTHLTLPTNREV